jgi:hypothetical protein
LPVACDPPDDDALEISGNAAGGLQAQVLQSVSGGYMKVKIIFVLFGSLLLLSSFLSQQFVFEKWNARYAQIRRAAADFTAYQSNNAMFNAIIEIAREDRKDRIRQLQLMNYQRALHYLWKEVSADSKAALASKGVHELGAMSMLSAPTADNIKKWSAEVQAQINFLQGEFQDEQKSIEHNKNMAYLGFSVLYIVGSVLIIIGNLISTQKDRAS